MRRGESYHEGEVRKIAVREESAREGKKVAAKGKRRGKIPVSVLFACLCSKGENNVCPIYTRLYSLPALPPSHLFS